MASLELYWLEILVSELAVGVSNLEFLQQFLGDYHDVDDFLLVLHLSVFVSFFFAFFAFFGAFFAALF